MLRTERTFIRNLCQSDIDDIYEYRNDVRCNKYQRYEDTSREYLTKYISEFSGSIFLSTEKEQHYGVCKLDGQLIGDLSIFYTQKDNCFTIGITISFKFQRQGYAFEVLKGVIPLLREKYPTVDIVALIEKENAGSIALFKKLNFIEECYADSIGSYVFVIYGKS